MIPAQFGMFINAHINELCSNFETPTNIFKVLWYATYNLLIDTPW